MTIVSKGRLSEVTIRSKADILPAAEALAAIGEDAGFRVAPWHDLSSDIPMTEPGGDPLCQSVFGWTGQRQWWQQLAKRKICPLAELCRYQTESFWSDVSAPVHERTSIDALKRTGLKWLWETQAAHSVLLVPVHQHFGRVGFVGFIAGEPVGYSRALVDELAAFGVAFVSSYTELVTSPSAKRVVSQPLSEQEIACLAWALDGKTDRDIAELIEKSYATVRFYMERAGGKLGTVNRVQTVAKAAMLGYISPREFAPH